ncbi:unnamed protein product [Echinostoma caproni]|uniref:Disintegrin domain-containing protein n=1 Tax=Echinostoma caproni TaxID=27848 RepID=A0A183ADQ0_9TREM|nr:unnamed protein product [Echinostoma caproni]
MADCLIPATHQEAARFWSDTCGNGQLDRGEECDPSSLISSTTGGTSIKDTRSRTGARVNTSDLLPCCNPITCLADVGAVCTHGACCDRCQLAVRGKQCRSARDLCDLPEFCTGAECYEITQTLSTFTGLTRNAMCGLLHCQGGKPRPVAADAGQPFLTYTEHNGQQFECKHLSHSSRVRFVPEGAACGPNQYCFHQQCVPPNVALRSRCPSGPVNQYTEDGSDRGVCTNAGFCLCHLGWTGDACQEVTSVDTQTFLSVASNRMNSVNRNILANPRLLPPEPDIAKRIWTQVEAMQRPDYKPDRDYAGGEQNGKTQLNTVYLIVILASVVGGTFLLLFVFMLIYRRRGQTGFARKRNRSRCFPLTGNNKRLGPHPSPYDPKGNGSLRLYETNTDGHDFQLALSPLRSRSARSAGEEDGFDYHNSSYLARWSHERRSRRHGKRHGSREPDYPETGDRHRSRRHRRRKHCRSDRHSGDDLDHSGRSSGRRTKYSDGSLATNRRLLDSHGNNHSDTELACRQNQDMEDETNTIDRIIKFGSMPSYKEDKLKQKRRHGDRNMDATTDSRKSSLDEQAGTRSAPPQSPPPAQSAGQLVAMVSVATECTQTNNAFNPGCGDDEDSAHHVNTSPTKNPGLSSPLSSAFRTTTFNSTLASSAPPPLFPHTTAAESLSPLSTGNGQTVTTALTKSVGGSHQNDLSQALGATAALIGAGKAGAAAAMAAASGTSNSSGTKSPLSAVVGDGVGRDQLHGKPSPNTDTLNGTDEMNDVHFSIVMENSWRQPEKGILKNRNEGGGLTSNTTSGSGHKSKSRKSDGDRRHRRHRSSHHRHHRRHKGTRSSSHRICDEGEADCCSLDSDCSCCLIEEGDKRASRDRSGSVQTDDCKRSSSRSRCTHTRHPSLLGSEASLRSHNSTCSARDGNTSATSSGSSHNGLSLSSQSSSSSSFSDLDRAGRDGVGDDMLLSTSSSSSTCSTALEVGPAGRIGRGTSTGENERSGGAGRDNDTATGASEREQHRYGSENAMLTGSGGSLSANGSTDQGPGPGPESSGSSSVSRTTTGAGLSGASSSSSGLLTPGGSTHMHRRHRRIRSRRSTDEDATTSGSHRSSPVPPVPTILCNAGQQTDEISLLKATGLTISANKDGKRSSAATKADDSEGEWEEVECSESACEECQAASATATASAAGPVPAATTGPMTNAPTASRCHPSESLPSQVTGYPPPKPFDCINPSPMIGGHTNAAYMPSMRSSGADANMSNTSIAYQQQSTASSSLGSSKNSRIGTPAPLGPNQQGPFHGGTQSPHGSALGVSGMKSGVTNRAASSSSCSSSSVAGHNQAFTRPMVPSTKSGPDDFPNQHSEPEVDAHLHHVPVSRLGAPFYSGMTPGPTGLVLGSMQMANPPGMNMMNPVPTTSYNMIPNPSHFLPPPPQQQPPPPPPIHPGTGMMHNTQQVRRDPYPNRFTGSVFPDNTAAVNQMARQPVRPIPSGPGSTAYPVTTDHNDTYYQHPYEEVATDDYAEANNHHQHLRSTTTTTTDSVYPSNHIYHQHGLPILNNGTSGSLVNGCVYEKGEAGDDEERLSLDEGHMGSLGPSPLGTRYDPAAIVSQPGQLLSNYPHLTAQDPRAGPQSPRWLDASGLSMNSGKHNTVPSDSANHRDSKSTSGMTDAEDAESEFSLSAFRRDDIRIPSYQLGSVPGGASNGSRGLLKPTHLRHLNAPDQTRASTRGSSELGTDIRSNDGTCDESDTSSLPEAGCDLVQLAQLDVSGRPNPLLNDLARQQASLFESTS